jgi:hypothetical protein
MTLVEFLQARIAEDEAPALAQVTDPAKHPANDMIGPTFDEVDNVFFIGVGRVLAECEAKRRIIAECEIQRQQCDELETALFADFVLGAMALPYAAHPDYDETWRP